MENASSNWDCIYQTVHESSEWTRDLFLRTLSAIHVFISSMLSSKVCYLRWFSVKMSWHYSFWNCKENADFEKLFEEQLREGSQIPRTYAANVHFLVFLFRGKSIYMGPKDLSPLNLRKKHTGKEK